MIVAHVYIKMILDGSDEISESAVQKTSHFKVSSNFSFIRIEHLYSASSRELLRGAPDSSTAKKSSLKVRENAGDKALGKIRS